jgi:hypothetical protein
MGLDLCLNFTPYGGIMRQAPKPWEALGMSRASWYRHGKPTEKPKRFTQAHEARKVGVSVRTIQRIHRVMTADKDLAALMVKYGWCKPGQAEQIIANRTKHRHFRKWLKTEKARIAKDKSP